VKATKKIYPGTELLTAYSSDEHALYKKQESDGKQTRKKTSIVL
jgi:hypothetical protein